MAKATRVHSTPPTNTTTIDENALSMRLLKAGMRLERHGDHFQVHSGNQIVFARTLTNKPLTLADIDDMTRRLEDPVVDPTRRLFLSQAAGVVAGGAALALATIPPATALAAPAGLPDPIFSLIEAHRTARAAYLAALAEHTRLDELGDPTAYLLSEAPCHAFLDALNELIEMAPTTLAGLQAWASCLDEIGPRDGDLLVEAGPTLIATLVEALGNLEVAS
jgi:hypothetical protein